MKVVLVLVLFVSLSMQEEGLRKEILKEGDGKSFPATGQQVTVHYTGTLTDGTKFDSSKDRNQPFSFSVGTGQVIKCWDSLIQKMSKGESARLHCPHEYAYGERGYPPVIPPKSTLIFDVDLIDFK